MNFGICSHHKGKFVELSITGAFCSSECQMVMNVLWSRLPETGKNWRYVYKVCIMPFYGIKFL